MGLRRRFQGEIRGFLEGILNLFRGERGGFCDLAGKLAKTPAPGMPNGTLLVKFVEWNDSRVLLLGEGDLLELIDFDFFAVFVGSDGGASAS